MGPLEGATTLVITSILWRSCGTSLTTAWWALPLSTSWLVWPLLGQVRQVDVTTVLASEAYVLFYRKASEGEFCQLALSGTLLWWLLIRHGDCQERGREAECSAQQVLKSQSAILLPPDLCQVWLVVEALHCQRLAGQVGHNGGTWTYRQFQRDLPARRGQMWQVLSSCFALWKIRELTFF